MSSVTQQFPSFVYSEALKRGQFLSADKNTQNTLVGRNNDEIGFRNSVSYRTVPRNACEWLEIAQLFEGHQSSGNPSASKWYQADGGSSAVVTATQSDRESQHAVVEIESR